MLNTNALEENKLTFTKRKVQNMYNELLTKANEELKKVVDYIKEHSDMFDMHDLKLHDVSYYIYRDMEKDFPLTYAIEDCDAFCTFCDNEYDLFMEWCNEHDIDFEKMIDRVGRTSKFYLHHFHDVNIDYMLFNIISKVGYYNSGDYITINNGVIVDTDYSEYEEETIEDLTYFAEEFYNDFIKEIADMIEVYEYIKDFKENQVGYFKDYVYEYEEELKYEKEKEKAEAIESHNVCMEIKDRYGISNEDMDALQTNIMHY